MENILIIDDDISIRTILSKTLTDHGCQVMVAEDGEAGICMLTQNEKFKAVITDICMPKKNGNDVARHIKNGRETSTTPVIGVTGFVEEAEKEIFDFLLEKPFKIQELLDIIDKL